MNKNNRIFSNIMLILIAIVFDYSYCYSKDTAPKKNELSTEQSYQNVIEEYKKYLQNIPQALKEEIRGYRKDMAKLNNQKKEIYKKLSSQGQEFLKKEREYKKKLPIKMRKMLNEDNQAESAKKSTNN